MQHTPQFESIRNESSRPASKGEIKAIGDQCGNGWRKVFNVYAKWLFQCPKNIYPFADSFSSWQAFRDQHLLQRGSSTRLVFQQTDIQATTGLTIVMGRTYANSLPIASQFEWLSPSFAIIRKKNLVVTPYFDYRQLTNEKIAFLTQLISKEFTPS